MAKVRKQLRELRGADVRYISLVDRAASRIPFRVLKRDKESDMIDLMGVFKREKAVVKPEVASVVVFTHKSADVAESIRKSIATAGFTTDTVQKADGGETTVYPQTDGQGEDLLMVRLSDQMIVVVKGFDVPTGLFSASVEDQGFYPGVGMAMQALYDKVTEIAVKSDDVQGDTKTVLASFNSYLQQLMSLPAACFKADAAVNAIMEQVKKEEQKSEPDQPNPAPNPNAEPNKLEQKEVPGLTSGAPGGSSTTITTVEKTDEEEKEAAAQAKKDLQDKNDEKAEKSDLQKVLDSVAAMSESNTKLVQEQFTTLTQKIDGVVAEQVAQKKVLDETISKADTLQKQLDTTVVAHPGGLDVPKGSITVKKEEDDDPRTGTFDTAFIGRRRRR